VVGIRLNDLLVLSSHFFPLFSTENNNKKERFKSEKGNVNLAFANCLQYIA